MNWKVNYDHLLKQVAWITAKAGEQAEAQLKVNKISHFLFD